jgi:glutamate N-acetyltransferase/amino-acid N-acetyltransferase
MAVGLKPAESLLPVPGVRLAVLGAELRYRNRPDMVLIALEPDSSVAATFTRNRFAAAPVIVAREHLASTAPRALLINAGQANAGTGEPGIAVARASCKLVGDALGVEAEAVLPFSTGVIGVAPPLDRMAAAIPGLIAALAEDNWLAAGRAIMTTDTVLKGVSRQAVIDGKTITISGITKGAGMIRPNMATMLAYVGTDAALAPAVLESVLVAAVEQSFNCITIDGDTSTNDACVLMATGRAGNTRIEKASGSACQAFQDAVSAVMQELAQAIVRDGEGATKFVAIRVDAGATESDCREVAFTIAHSPLVKTALFASDPNWGRILAAVGRAPIGRLDIDRVAIDVNGVAIVRGGAVAPSYTEEQGKAAMAPEEIEIVVNLGAGVSTATVWTCDFSHEYVTINAEYRT